MCPWIGSGLWWTIPLELKTRRGVHVYDGCSSKHKPQSHWIISKQKLNFWVQHSDICLPLNAGECHHTHHYWLFSNDQRWQIPCHRILYLWEWMYLEVYGFHFSGCSSAIPLKPSRQFIFNYSMLLFIVIRLMHVPSAQCSLLNAHAPHNAVRLRTICITQLISNENGNTI